MRCGWHALVSRSVHRGGVTYSGRKRTEHRRILGHTLMNDFQDSASSLADADDGDGENDDLRRVVEFDPLARTWALEMFLQGLHGTARELATGRSIHMAYEKLAVMADGIFEVLEAKASRREQLKQERDNLHYLLDSSVQVNRRRTVTDSVDNFLSYLADVAALIMKHRPETLRTQAEVPVADVLAHPSMEEFIEWLAEREVSRLTMRGLPDVAEYFLKRFGLPVGKTEEQIQLLRSATLVRNLNTHRRGIVDRRFMDAIATYPVDSGTLGEPWEVPSEYAQGVMLASLDAAAHIDRLVIEKFALSTLTDVHGEQCWGCGWIRHRARLGMAVNESDTTGLMDSEQGS